MNDNKLLAILIGAVAAISIVGIISASITEKTPHEQRMEVLREIEYEKRIFDNMDSGENVNRFKHKLDSLHIVQDSIYKLK